MATGSDFIDVAAELVDGRSEPFWRSATSRAYYAAFHHARDALAEKDLKVPANSSGHGMLRRCLNHASDFRLEEAATGLDTLQSHRLRADYDFDGKPSQQEQAVFDVRLAKTVIKQVEQSPLKVGSTEAVVQAIREYLQKTNQRLA